MNRERIADDIYVFTSKRYAQVTCGAILTKEGVVLIDTLFYPDEARAVRDFLEERLNQRVRYVVNTHYHADHTTGTYLYPQSQVISHSLCREMLDTTGRDGLAQMKSQLPEFADAEIILPNLTVKRGTLDIQVGGKTLRMIHMPGHSADLLAVHVLNDDILFASDNMMPVPTLFDGDFDDLKQSLLQILGMMPDTVVQGHGEVVLRGEVEHVVSDNVRYMETARKKVERLVARGKGREALEGIDIESCGKSRIPLNGFVTELHLANLFRLYEMVTAQREAAPS